MGSVTHLPVVDRKITAADYADQHIMNLEAADIEDALGYVPADAADVTPPDLSAYATDAELAAGLAGKSDTGHNHDALYYTEAEVTALLAGKSDTSHDHDSRYYTESEVDALLAAKATATAIALMADAMPLTFNFTGTGEMRFYADEAMTLTQQATSGTGTIVFAKSTAAAPTVFNTTTSPISLEAGAWLKVSASAVTTVIAVHLKRTV